MEVKFDSIPLFPCLCASIAAMTLLGASSVFGADKGAKYYEPIVTKPLFVVDDIAILAVDRDKLATNIATFVANSIKPGGNADEIDTAARLIGLALHLDPRNRMAVVVNFQLKKGLAPRKVEAEYSPVTLAGLLQRKAEFIHKQGGDLNEMLAGFMLAAAVEIDPRNETAIYQLEMYRKAVAEIDWTPIVGRVRSGTVRSGD